MLCTLLLPEEAPAAFLAAELVVVAVGALVLDEVRAAREGLAALLTLVGFNPAVGDDVGLQLVRTVKLLCAA